MIGKDEFVIWLFLSIIELIKLLIKDIELIIGELELFCDIIFEFGILDSLF